MKQWSLARALSLDMRPKHFDHFRPSVSLTACSDAYWACPGLLPQTALLVFLRPGAIVVASHLCE